MDIQLYMKLRRYAPGSDGIEGLREKQSRFVRMIALLIVQADREGYELTFGDAWSRKGHMKGSLHYSRLAFDLNLFMSGEYLTKTKDYKSLGLYWESIGGSWGGRWKDGGHFSLEHEGIR